MSSYFLQEYFPIFIFLITSIFLSCIIFGLSYLLAIHKPDSEKLSPYECGFDPYEDARQAFDVRFYLVSMLFIIFDLEAMYLFPWAISLHQTGSMGFWTMIEFLFELGIGFVYAWKIGALEWE
jgi:NADH-quinone oxidoreductase subunit A